jgi:hypothetical protein
MIHQLYNLELKYQNAGDYCVIRLGGTANDGRSFLIHTGPVDINETREWLKELIKHQDEEFPFELRDEEPLSSAVIRLYDEMNPEADYDSFELLYKYRCIHDFSLCNRGIDTPIIIVGKRRGRLTISKGGEGYYLLPIMQKPEGE